MFTVEGALASAPPKIMMRLNAPISALLALAALFLFPAFGFARPTRRFAHSAPVHRVVGQRTARARKTSAASPSRHGTRREAAVARVSRRHSGTERPVSARQVRVQAVRGRRSVRHEVRGRYEVRGRREVRGRGRVRTELTALDSGAGAGSGKATSQDFLSAASGHGAVSAAMAIHGTARPDEPRARRFRTTVSARGRRRMAVSRPVSVVSVVRPTERKPQLPSIEEAGSTPFILPALYNKRGRLIMPRALKGSHEILVHQNEVADRDGLQRIQNDDDLMGMRDRGLLVALPLNAGMQVDERLPGNRRYCRPWTAQFLANLSRAHYEHFHTPLQVNSAVRTVEFQEHLMHINGNAAPAGGDTASPHLTGQAIDLAKHGLSLTEIAWMRGYLLPLVQEGKIDVEEEFQQSCFHISVYKRYVPSAGMPERDLASSHREGMPALATALR